ncbi:hypothetical protein SDC9_67438 [bioreactor metagenome]|uniref:Uncharacterized protein n=1 Tax=bioreactor metagenome TaxID=1076179 RepID=A0A644XY24_9ZZZZ
MRQHALNIVQFRHPLRIPLQRDKPVVVNGGKRRHELRHRQFAFARQAIGANAVFQRGILDVYVLNVRAEVFDAGFGRFAVLEVRVMQIPKRGERIARKTHQEFLEQRGIRKCADGFD